MLERRTVSKRHKACMRILNLIFEAAPCTSDTGAILCQDLRLVEEGKGEAAGPAKHRADGGPFSAGEAYGGRDAQVHQELVQLVAHEPGEVERGAKKLAGAPAPGARVEAPPQPQLRGAHRAITLALQCTRPK